MQLSPSSAIDSANVASPGPERAAGMPRTVSAVRVGDVWRVTFFAMGSPCEVLSEASSRQEAIGLAGIAAAEAWRIEDKYSRYIDGNIVDRFNSANGSAVIVDDETARLIDFAAELFELSDGRFDITSGVLRRVWTFDGSDRLPSRSAVRKLLRWVGWNKVCWQAPAFSMAPGMQIDFGGIGKEYAVDRAAALLRDCAAESCLVNFGGDIAVSRRPTLQPAWQVGIESGARPGAADRVVSLVNGALATSGDSRRFLQKDGVRYCHIIDPTSGWPVADAPVSVTVAADTCVQAGMISTFAMLCGPRAEQFLEQQDLKYWCGR